MDKTEIQMYIATAKELIATYTVDVIPNAEGDELLEAQGKLASVRQAEKELAEELDKYLTHEEAIHFFRRVILQLRCKRCEFDDDWIEFTTDSKFEVERLEKAARTLDGWVEFYDENAYGEGVFLIELSKETLKEIQTIKKPRKRRKPKATKR